VERWKGFLSFHLFLRGDYGRRKEKEGKM